MVTDWMQAVITFLQLAGTRPICPVSRRSRIIAFFPFFAGWHDAPSLSWESSQIPSQRVASLLNGTVLVPTIIVAVGVVFSYERVLPLSSHG